MKTVLFNRDPAGSALEGGLKRAPRWVAVKRLNAKIDNLLSMSSP
jgi:hypothetical protein